MPETAAQQIGKYQVLRLLGRGGMGSVHLGYDFNLERHVAIKCLNSQLIQSGEYSQLLKEAKILAQLNHPNIVQLYDFIEDDKQFAIVMEYVKGRQLSDYFLTKQYTHVQALTWLKQIAEGISAAHEKNIIHRDLKAENLLVNDVSYVKVTDFGIAKRSCDPHTHQALTMGSYLALSPEQIASSDIDFRSDYFSLGLLAYQLFCGKHPFARNNPAQLIHGITYQQPLAPSALCPGMTNELEALILALLEKDRTNRPNNGPELCQSIDDIITRENSGALPASYSPAKPAPDHLEMDQQSAYVQTGDIPDNYIVTPTETLNINLPQPDQLHANITNEKFRRRFFATFTCLTLAGLIAFFIFRYESTPPNKHIAIIEPALESLSQDHLQQHRFTTLIIKDAIEQFIIHTGSLSLIPASEFNKSSTTLKSRALATKADIILQPSINCTYQHCEVSISTIEGPLWTVTKKQQWPISSENRVNIYDSTQTNLAKLLNSYSKRLTNLVDVISEENYLTYIRLNDEYRINDNLNNKANTEEALTKVNNLIQQSAKFFPLYRLKSKILHRCFITTNEAHYLKAWKQTLEDAEQKLPQTQDLQTLWFNYFKATKNQESLNATITKLQDLGMSHYDELIHRASAAEALDDYDTASNLYEQIIEIRPSLYAFRQLTLTYWYLGKRDKAKNILKDQVLRLAPHHYWGNSMLATIYVSEGSLTKAERLNKKLIEEKPDAFNYNNLGLVYLLKSEFLEARKNFEEALNKTPNRLIILSNLASAEQSLGNLQKSNALYHQIVTLSSKLEGNEIEELEQERAEALAHLGHDKEAVSIILDKLNKQENNPDLLFKAALIYSIIGEGVSAIVYAEKAIKHGIGPIWFHLPIFSPLCKKPEFVQLVNLENKKACQLSRTNTVIDKHEI